MITMMGEPTPVPEEDVEADVSLERRIVDVDDLDDEEELTKLIQFQVKPGKNRLVVRIRPRRYQFSL